MKKFAVCLLLGWLMPLISAEIQYTRTIDTPNWRIPREGKKLSKIRIFAERQSYLPNQCYLHHFIDRPLFTDTSLRKKNLEKDGFLHDVNILLKSGYQGFGTIAYNSLYRTHLIYFKEARPAGYEHSLVMPGDPSNPATYAMWRERLIMSAPAECMSKIDGKIICIFYGNSNPQLLKNVENAVKKLHNDPKVPPFVFITDLSFISMYMAFNKYAPQGQEVPAAEVESFRQQLRDQLKVADGVILRVFENYTQPVSKGYGCRVQPTDLYEKYLLPVMREEFAKPEHKGKLVALYPRHGYTNHIRGTVHYECGTEVIRTYLTGGAKLSPDVLMLFEWNEANENTSFQPTVANGRSMERILHYARRCYDNEDPTPRPGDDVSIPNMILSIPQCVRPGETLHAELFNVPDTLKSGEISAELILLDSKGQKIAALPAEKFNRNELRAVTWSFPAEQFAPYLAVNYQLKLTENGKTTLWDHFDYTKISPTTNIRYKYSRMPLRDKLEVSGGMQVTPLPDGSYRVDVNVASPEELAAVEVVDNHTEVYSYDSAKEFEDRVVFRGYYTALADSVVHSGWYSMPGIKDWKVRSLNFNYEVFSNGLTIGDRLRVEHRFVSYGRANFVVSVPKSEMAKNPLFHMDYKGFERVTFDLNAVLKEGKIAKNLGGRIRFELHRADTLVDYPVPVNSKKVSFSTVIKPVVDFPLVQLRVVSKSGKILRSPVVAVKEPGKELENMRIWSETAGKPVEIAIAKERIPDIKMEFDPRKGLFAGHSGAPEWEISLGGGTAGGSPFDENLTSLTKKKIFPAEFGNNFPAWEKVGENYQLRFDGVANYMVFSRDLIPRSAPYIVEFEIKRDREANEVLLRTGCQSLKYNCGLDLVIANGKLRGFYTQHFHRYTAVFATKLDVPVGKWTKIRVIKSVDKLTFEVDGRSESFDYNGRGSFFCLTVFGGTAYQGKKMPENLTFFQGALRSFRVHHNDKESK